MSAVRTVRPRPLNVDERIPVYWAGREAPPEIKAIDGGSLFRYLVAGTPKTGQKRARGDKYHAPKEARGAAGGWGGVGWGSGAGRCGAGRGAARRRCGGALAAASTRALAGPRLLGPTAWRRTLCHALQGMPASPRPRKKEAANVSVGPAGRSLPGSLPHVQGSGEPGAVRARCGRMRARLSATLGSHRQPHRPPLIDLCPPSPLALRPPPQEPRIHVPRVRQVPDYQLNQAALVPRPTFTSVAGGGLAQPYVRWHPPLPGMYEEGTAPEYDVDEADEAWLARAAAGEDRGPGRTSSGGIMAAARGLYASVASRFRSSTGGEGLRDDEDDAGGSAGSGGMSGLGVVEFERAIDKLELSHFAAVTKWWNDLNDGERRDRQRGGRTAGCQPGFLVLAAHCRVRCGRSARGTPEPPAPTSELGAHLGLPPQPQPRRHAPGPSTSAPAQAPKIPHTKQLLPKAKALEELGELVPDKKLAGALYEHWLKRRHTHGGPLLERLWFEVRAARQQPACGPAACACSGAAASFVAGSALPRPPLRRPGGQSATPSVAGPAPRACQVPWKFVAFAHLLGNEDGNDEALPFMEGESRSAVRRAGGRRRINEEDAKEALYALRAELEVRSAWGAGSKPSGGCVQAERAVGCSQPHHQLSAVLLPLRQMP